MRAGKTAVEQQCRPLTQRSAVLAGAVVLALGATCAIASPAIAHDTPPPASVVDWPTVYSPLTASEVVAAGDTTLEFEGTDAGLHDAAGVHTGFTLVQPSSGLLHDAAGALQAQTDAEYYLPAHLSVTGGALHITATRGTASGTQVATDVYRNRQDNTLGVAVDVGDEIIRLQATVVNPAGIHSSAQAGLWFGPDDENYLKLAYVGSGDANDTHPRQVHLKREVGGGDQTDAASQIIVDIKNAYVAAPVESPVHLTLDIDPVALTATGTYQFGTNPPLSAGTVSVPQKWLTAQVAGAPRGVAAIGGIFATAGAMTDISPVLSFDRFSAVELDSTPPGSVDALSADGIAGAIELTWTAPDDDDVAGYRVFRSATAEVEVAGDGIGGEALLVDPVFADPAVTRGDTWHYAVVAYDEVGNASEPVTTSGSPVVPTRSGSGAAR